MGKLVVLNVRIEQTMLEKLKKLSSESGYTLSEYVRNLIMDYCAVLE